MIRKRRGSLRFDASRYPGFAYRKTGKYAYHWEAVVDEAGLESARRSARSDRFSLEATPLEFARSSGYRGAFVAAHPGPYRCRYCNRRLGAADMTVDHVVPVAMAGRSAIARKMLGAMGASGVNDLENLAPACARCNARKAAKGGLWIVRGLLGGHRAYWAALYFAAVALTAVACFAAWRVFTDPQGAVSTLGNLLDAFADQAGDWVLKATGIGMGA